MNHYHVKFWKEFFLENYSLDKKFSVLNLLQYLKDNAPEDFKKNSVDEILAGLDDAIKEELDGLEMEWRNHDKNNSPA